MFNIIIPVSKNHESLLKKTVNSILKQTLTNYKVIIMGDGFVPSTIEDDRIIVRGTDTKEGIWGTTPRNEALKFRDKNRPFLCYIDADNEWLPHHLEVCLELMNQAPLSCTGFYAKDPLGRIAAVNTKEMKLGRIDTNGICINLSVISSEDIIWLKEYVHDFKLFESLAQKHPYVVSDKITYFYNTPDARNFYRR